MRFETINELKLKVTGAKNQELVNEECCTCINIILKNDGQIQTSFLGAHNPEIVKLLERAQKVYFKSLKKTLKAKYYETENPCECEDNCKCTPEEHCGCGGHEHNHEHKHGENCSHKHNHKHTKNCCCEPNHIHEECNCGCEEHSKKQSKKADKSK